MVYDQSTLSVTFPTITTPNSEYMGEYQFLIKGANSAELEISSESITINVDLSYDTTNRGPLLVSPLEEIFVE